MFLYSYIAGGGDSFARCPLHKGTKSVLRLLLLCLPCITGEYLNSGSNYDVYLAKGLLLKFQYWFYIHMDTTGIGLYIYIYICVYIIMYM